MDVDQIFGTYTSWKYDSRTWFITSLGGSQYMYLIEGDDMALLIDTGYGAGNLRQYVEALTDKPILVVNTHGHLDHVGGNGWWDKVYMAKDYLIDHTTLQDSPVDLSKLPFPDYEKIIIGNGHVFHLGGCEIEVIEAPAHAVSSIFLLDRSTGALFCGDELESAQVLFITYDGQSTDIAAVAAQHLQNMKLLQRRDGEIRSIFPAHNGAPISKEYIQEFCELDEMLISGQFQFCEKLNHFFLEQRPDGSQLRRIRHKHVSIVVKVI